MKIPFELTIGLTYTRAGRRGRRKDRFMSFISGMSVASIALGVAALIIVLSVMNGFQKEVRDRMLSVIPHIEVSNADGAIAEWEPVAEAVRQHPEVPPLMFRDRRFSLQARACAERCSRASIRRLSPA